MGITDVIVESSRILLSNGYGTQSPNKEVALAARPAIIKAGELGLKTVVR